MLEVLEVNFNVENVEYYLAIGLDFAVPPSPLPENSDPSKWKERLEEFLNEPEDPVPIITLRKSLPSASRPVFARGIDKKEYVIKGQQAGRQVINDQIVARLGQALGAPVAEPRIVEISAELLELGPAFDYLKPGTAHGVVFIPDCSDDREYIKYTQEPRNRSKFALLAVLYGWVYAQDHQLIYTKKMPHDVFSVDHGFFFYLGPNWSIQSLAKAPPANLDSQIANKAKFTPEELQPAFGALASINEEMIVKAIASVPLDWEITIEERIALIEYLLRRQEELLGSFRA